MTIAGYILLAIWVYVGIYAIVNRICTCIEKREFIRVYGNFEKNKSHINNFYDTMKKITDDLKKENAKND